MILFLFISIFLLGYSLPALGKPRSHGFFRFFAWEAVFGLLLLNWRSWFADPFSLHQVLSWFLLLVSLFLLLEGVILLRRVGKPEGSLEATTRLVQSGAYRFIRHPLYASLLFLAWGIFLKAPTLLGGCTAAVATAFLYATARADERECLVKFGQEYAAYMQRTKMFLPFLF